MTPTYCTKANRYRDERGRFCRTQAAAAAVIAEERGVQILGGKGLVIAGMALYDALRRGSAVTVISATGGGWKRMAGYEAAAALISRQQQVAA